MPVIKRWLGDVPEVCDLDPTHKITNTFIDGRVREAGSWANMCPDCHGKYGVGLGQGYGQKYQRTSTVDGKGNPVTHWIKVGG